MQPETITLTPDFEEMFRQMAREAKTQGDARHLFRGCELNVRAGLLREIQRFVWPLAMAANSATTVAAVEEYRELITGILTGIDLEAQRLELRIQEREETPESGERGLL